MSDDYLAREVVSVGPDDPLLPGFIVITCQVCGTRAQVALPSEGLAATTGRCPRCRERFGDPE